MVLKFFNPQKLFRPSEESTVQMVSVTEASLVETLIGQSNIVIFDV